MGNLVLITGGGRSGKSSYAQGLAEALGGRRFFLATCPPIDDEITARIRRHEREREGRGWETIEEMLDLATTISQVPECEAILVDCLTLWINNLMFKAEKSAESFDEDEMSGLAKDRVLAAQSVADSVFMVTNEVGMGIVTERPAVRFYRDLVGRCNQVAARAADRVILMVSGHPV